jgi:uncharacterized protein YkwD
MKMYIFIVLLLTAVTITVLSSVNRTQYTQTKSLPVPSETPSATPEPARIPVTVTPAPLQKAQKLPSTAPATSPVPSQGSVISNDLNSTVNAYRAANGRNALTVHATLCRIAVTRVNQMVQAGSLDNHAGFQAQSESQKEFLHVGEILQYRSPQESPTYLVYTGWAGSAQHNPLLLDPGWTHGCGSISGLFAVFIFGRN